MNSLSVLFLLFTCTSVYTYSSYPRHRNLRSLPKSSSLYDIRLNDNEIHIDPSSEELPEIIRRKKSAKKEKMTLEDLKLSETDEEFSKQSSKNVDEKLSAPITLQEVHGIDKNDTEVVTLKGSKNNDRIRRQHLIMPNSFSSGSGEPMLIMPRPMGLQNSMERPSNPISRTHGLGISSESGLGIGINAGVGATKLPAYYSSSGLAAVHELPLQTHSVLQPAHHLSSYASVSPHYSQPFYSCLCPCNQHSNFQAYPYGSSQLGGAGFSQLSGLGGGVSVAAGKSSSNLNDDVLQSPYIFQGPKLNSGLMRSRGDDHFSDGHQHTSDCNMDSLSSFNFDKNVMAGLMDNEEKKLAKIEECAKKNNLNSIEYAMLVNMVNSELDLLKNEVKSMQRAQQQQQKPQQQQGPKS